MRNEAIERHDQPSVQISQGNALLFTSANRELHAWGSARRIVVSARGGERRDSPIQTAIRDALECVRQEGQANPIVIGAIPFDLAEPSCLYAPTHYEWRSRSAMPSRVATHLPRLLEQRSTPDEVGFKRSVEHAIVNFRHSDIRKAVLSVIRELRFSASVDVDQLLRSLRAQNPHGYQFRIPLPDGAELIGVSPELLLRKQGGQIISNPLAGSAKRQPDPQQDQASGERLLRSEKDHYEHRIVIEEMQRLLQPLCIELDIPTRPSLLSTAAMWHLATTIAGQLHDPSLTALQLACRLHPTPAVCGLPTDRARKLISLVEPFDRGLFTGMVGWCDGNGDGEWAVTIRCGTVNGNTVRLFAGAGIVEASQPDAEWAEIEAKLGTMLRACGLSTELCAAPLSGVAS